MKFSGVALAGGLATTIAYLYLNDESSYPVIDRLTIPIWNERWKAHAQVT